MTASGFRRTNIAMMVLVCMTFLSACSPVRVARDVVVPPVKWEFIQSVGGLRVGSPYVDSSGVLWLNLTMDLSGNTTITSTPTVTNTNRKCIRTTLAAADVFDRQPFVYDLDLQIYAGEVGEQSNGSCEQVPIFPGMLTPVIVNLSEVTFRVWYRDSRFSRHQILEFRM